MNASRQIRCRRVVDVAYRGAIVKCLERNLWVGLVVAIYRDRSAHKIDDRDVRNNQRVEIVRGGICNYQFRWEGEERAMYL